MSVYFTPLPRSSYTPARFRRQVRSNGTDRVRIGCDVARGSTSSTGVNRVVVCLPQYIPVDREEIAMLRAFLGDDIRAIMQDEE